MSDQAQQNGASDSLAPLAIDVEAQNALAKVTHEVPAGIGLIPYTDPAIPPYKVRHISVEEGLRRHAERVQQRHSHDPAAQKERDERAAREADTEAAARRSQAEIRRHMDAYFKEWMETTAGEVLSRLFESAMARLTVGIAELKENHQIQIDRLASDMRRDFRAFCVATVAGKDIP